MPVAFGPFGIPGIAAKNDIEANKVCFFFDFKILGYNSYTLFSHYNIRKGFIE